MWNHIYEQSDRLKDLFASSQVEEFVQAYDTKALRRIIFVASGSSLNITWGKVPVTPRKILFHGLFHKRDRGGWLVLVCWLIFSIFFFNGSEEFLILC
jgi:hypothetical protein